MGRVMKRVEKIGKYCTYGDKEIIAGMKRVFAPRCATLRSLEGWYPIREDKAFKFSCNYNDILRAADSKHFGYSCFRPQGAHKLQPLKRLLSPNWAVIFLPDKAGNVQARTWVQSGTLPKLELPYSEDQINRPYADSWGYSGCDCETCVKARKDDAGYRLTKQQQWEQKIEQMKESNRQAQERHDARIQEITSGSKVYLTLASIQGSNLHLDEIITALDSVATLEVVSDIYL